MGKRKHRDAGGPAQGEVTHHQVLDGALAGVRCVLEDETQEGDLRSRQRHTSCEGLRGRPDASGGQPLRRGKYANTVGSGSSMVKHVRWLRQCEEAPGARFLYTCGQATGRQ